MNFIQSYKRLVPSLIFTFLLVIGRVIYTGHTMFAFIVWNLFLAIIPLYASYKIEIVKTKIKEWLFACLWLLFFPNSMYITTDLLHLKERGDIPLWYDLLLLLSAALNGVILGFYSLRQIEKWLLGYVKQQHLQIIIFILLILCGYGIYLGRYERWNSWDIIVSPWQLLFNIGHHFIHPFRNRDIWYLSVAFGVWMYLLYQYIPKITNLHKKE